jgi:leucyl aminopeptidase
MAKTIGQLTQATTLAGGDEFIIEQSGLTKRVAASVVRGGLVNADIDAAAAIAFSKLAALDSANLLVGNGSNVATKVAVTGDVTISNAGVTAIGSSKVVTAMVNNGAITAAKLDGAQTGSAPIYGCRAWVNFDGTTSTPTIRASGNVTNVTKNGTGDYTVNFTTAMSDTNYSAVSSVGAASSSNATLVCAKYAGTSTSASFRVQSTSNAALSTYFDLSDISVQFFR